MSGLHFYRSWGARSAVVNPMALTAAMRIAIRMLATPRVFRERRDVRTCTLRALITRNLAFCPSLERVDWLTATLTVAGRVVASEIARSDLSIGASVREGPWLPPRRVRS